MNTKKLLAGLFSCLILMAASCTTDSADDSVYEQGVDKSKIVVPSRAVDKSKIIVPSRAVDKSKIIRPSSR